MNIWKAAQKGDVNTIKTLLAANNVIPDSSDRWGRTPLSFAAEEGHKDIVEMLIAMDSVNPDSSSSEGRTPLSFAAGEGNKDIVEMLIAIDSVNLDSSDFEGWTPLIFAVIWGHEDIVEMLIAIDSVNPDLSSSEGRTPLSFAAEEGNKDIVEMLIAIDSVNPDSSDSEGRTPLSFAAEWDRKDIVEILIAIDSVNPDSSDSEGRTPLSFAAERGYKDIVEMLIAIDGINPESSDSKGRTPLSFAIAGGYKDVAKCLFAKLLANDTVYLSPRNINDRVLLWAAKNGREILVKLLFEYTELDCKDSVGRTPLSWASENGHGAVVKLLLKHAKPNSKNGIDPNSQDSVGRTPLSWASENGHGAVVKLLLKHAKPNSKDGIDPDSKDSFGRTPLSWASRNGHGAVVKLLLEHAEPNSKDSIGRTPLLWAVIMGRLEIVEELVSLGADINTKDSSNMTPLRFALERKDLGFIKLLLEKSVDTTGIMADEWLKAYGRQAPEKLLLSEETRGKRVDYPTEIPDDFPQISAETRTKKRLFIFAGYPLEKPCPIPCPIPRLGDTLQDNKSQILYQEQPQQHGPGVGISIASWYPAAHDQKFQKPFVVHYYECGIAWTMTPRINRSNESYWESIDHFSMLPYGWIPCDGIGFLQQLIDYLKRRWLEVCQQAEKHLTDCRLVQLHSEGRSPELMHRLAKDAQTWANLRNILQGQVLEATKHITDYCQRYNANSTVKDLKESIDKFELSVNNRIAQLDQTSRDLLQIEFAWASVTEARISTKLGQNVMLLTYVSIFYLPLAFCAALWAIPDITNSGTRDPFVITSVIVGLITLFVAFNLENITGSIRKLYHCWRGKMLRDMRSDNRWQKRGEEFQDFNPTQTTPSEWWLLGYLAYRLIKAVTKKVKGKKEKKLKADGNNAC